jgi:hypothetical protein
MFNMQDPRGFEGVIFFVALCLFLTSLVYFPHSSGTGFALLLTSAVTTAFAYAIRAERLELQTLAHFQVRQIYSVDISG